MNLNIFIFKLVNMNYFILYNMTISKDVATMKTMKDLKSVAKKIGVSGSDKFKKDQIESLRKIILNKLKTHVNASVKNKITFLTRKSPKKVLTLSPKTIKKAKVIDVSNNVDDEYIYKGYVSENKYWNFMNFNASNAIKRYKLKNGDIVFTGHPYETRQEYGFGMVKDDKIMSNGGVYGMGVSNGINAMAKSYKLTNIDFTNAKSNMRKFGQQNYMFLNDK